jgi:hypothetical protein
MLAAQQVRKWNAATNREFAETNLGPARRKSIVSAGERFGLDADKVDWHAPTGA